MASKKFSGILFSAFWLFFFHHAFAWAQTEYPSKPITLIIGYSTGSTSDLTARALAPSLETVLKQPIVVVNKPGAGGALALSLVAQAKPDGYTIGFVAAAATVINPHIEKLAYDPLKDFTYIAGIWNYTEALVVRADSPWKTFQDFVNYSQQNPGLVKYGTYGVYSVPTLVMGAVAKKLGIQWDVVPFKSDAESITALLGGHVSAAGSIAMYVPQVRAGNLRVLAVMSEKKSVEFAAAPTLKDLGYEGLAGGFGVGVGGPRGLSEPTRGKLEQAFAQAVKAPSYLELIKKLNLIEDYMNSKEFGTFVAESFNRHGRVIREIGLEVLKK